MWQPSGRYLPDDQLPAGQTPGRLCGLEEKVNVQDDAEPHHTRKQVKEAGGETKKAQRARSGFPGLSPPPTTTLSRKISIGPQLGTSEAT